MKAPIFGCRPGSRLVTVFFISMAFASWCACRAERPADAAQTKAATPRGNDTIGCLGRIEAGDGIVRVASRGLNGQAIINRLFVKEGDRVTVGQPLADLDTKEQLEASLRQATAGVEVARRRLAQAQSGAKPSDVAGQEAEIQRLEGELDNAEQEHQRYASLGDNVTASELDRLKLRVDSTTRALAAARHRLASLNEVRPVDVEVARAELEEAIRTEARANADYKFSVIHSPIDGRVIKIDTWPGEAVGPDGLLELAPLEPMYVIAEVAESDISRVKVGQRATISGTGLANPVQGKVARVGLKVLQNELLRVDPANFSDARVVEVWITVDDSRAVADLIHLRVDVVIQS
jgi:HlyD family secretion protein